MEHSNDWDLQALVRSCGTLAADNEAEPPAPAPVPMPVRRGGVSYGTVGRAAAAAPEFVGRPVSAASFYDLEYLDLYDDLPRAPFLITPASASSRENEVFISFPAASTSGQSSVQPRKQPGRKPGVRTPRPKRSKKSQVKKVVCEVPVADGGVSTDLWAWRKYGQKPIKGSPYPRGYYKCSSLKACKARKMVERSPANPEVLVVTYIAEHCHAVPMQLNTLAGTTRNKPDSPDDGHSTSHGAAPDKREDSADTCSTAVDELTADDENNELWPPVDMELDDLFFSSFDDDFDCFLDDGALLGRRLSL